MTERPEKSDMAEKEVEDPTGKDLSRWKRSTIFTLTYAVYFIVSSVDRLFALRSKNSH
jgi:hypothetical protein